MEEVEPAGPLQRCEPDDGRHRAAAARNPALPRDWAPVQRFRVEVDRPSELEVALRSSPFDPRRFRRIRPFGSSRPDVAARFYPDDSPLFGLPLSSKRQPPYDRSRPKAEAPLLGFRPLQRSTEVGTRIVRRFRPPVASRPQGFTPSRRLASPTTLQGLFHPRCALGVPPDLPRSPRPCGQGRATDARVSSSGRSPLRRWIRVGGSSSRSSIDARPLAKRVPNGDAESRSPEDRFAGSRPATGPLEVLGRRSRLVDAERLPGFWVAPRSSGRRRRLPSDLYETFRVPTLRLHESHVPAADPTTNRVVDWSNSSRRARGIGVVARPSSTAKSLVRTGTRTAIHRASPFHPPLDAQAARPDRRQRSQIDAPKGDRRRRCGARMIRRRFSRSRDSLSRRVR